jgi:hypothetical protein
MIGIKSRYALSFVPFAVSNQEGNRDDMLVRGSVNETLTDDYDLVQTGIGDHYFVIELSSSDRETFAAFVSRMTDNSVLYEDSKRELSYTTILNGDVTETIMDARYDTHFKVGGLSMDMNYQRYESMYHPDGKIQRKDEVIRYAFNGKALTLNYQMLQRNVVN